MKKIILVLSLILTLASCDAQLTEKVEVTYPSGQPELVLLFDKSGECVRSVEYYESGVVKMEGEIKDGKRNGEWTAYFPDGRVQSHGYFKDDKRAGASIVYWNNGNLRSEGFYTEGKHSGKWKWYDEQGIFLREDDYGE